MSIGAGESDDDEFGRIPDPASFQKTNNVEIMPNQFGDDDSEEEESKEMGTDYDPPTRTEGVD